MTIKVSGDKLVDSRTGQSFGGVAENHTHPVSDVTNLAADLAARVLDSDARLTDARTPLSHAHTQSDVTGLVSALAGKAASSHAHLVSETTGLQATLDAKAAVAHAHAESDVTGLVADLAGKAASVHSHTQAEVTNLVTDLAGKAAATHSITASHNGFPGTGLTYLRDDGLWAAPVASVADPNSQSYTPGTFSVSTGRYVLLSRRLQLTGTQRATLAGTSRMRIT